MIRRLFSILAFALPLAAFAQDSHDAPSSGKSFWGWFPPNINSAYGEHVDGLYLMIMILVLVAFFATELAMLYCCFAFREREGHRATYMHGSNKLEAIWTAVPAVLLLALALVQAKGWADIKAKFPKMSEAYTVQVYAEQFKWHMRYPNDSKGGFNTPDGGFSKPMNVLTNSQLHVPVNLKVMCIMASRDVIHSFFIPNARVKQDVLPGMVGRIWFKVDRIPCWDLKEQKPAFLTAQEFEATTVGLDPVADWVWERKPVGATEKDDKGQWKPVTMTGVREFKYLPLILKKTGKPKEKITILDKNKVREGTYEECKYVHHYAEIACAELCGMGHTTMRAEMRVHNSATMEWWIKKELAEIEEQEGRSPDEEKKWVLWDKFYADYNK